VQSMKDGEWQWIKIERGCENDWMILWITKELIALLLYDWMQMSSSAWHRTKLMLHHARGVTATHYSSIPEIGANERNKERSSTTHSTDGELISPAIPIHIQYVLEYGCTISAWC
jgi:hypothetical protein